MVVKKTICWLIDQVKIAKPLHFDHIGVCLTVALLGWIIFLISEKIGIFDPIKIALDDFYTTDVYYEMMHSDNPDIDQDILIIDMTELSTRNEIAKVITDIRKCEPKLLCIDLIFEHPSYDPISDDSLITSLLQDGCRILLPCKLRNYDNESEAFQDCLHSFFYTSDNSNISCGYCNYRQIRMGGCTRETSVCQNLKDSVVYSFPFMASCLYKGKEIQSQPVNESHIMYDDIDFQTICHKNVLKEAENIKGKLVILGTLHEEADTHFTPLGKMPGAKVVAYSIHTYLKGEAIKDFGITNSFIIAMITWWLAACIGYWIEKRHNIIYAILAKIVNFTLGVFIIWISFEVYARYQYNIDLLYPLLGLAMVEDIREMYTGIIRWLQAKTHLSIFSKSLYKL